MKFTSQERRSHVGSYSDYSFVETDYTFTNPNLIVHRTKYASGIVHDSYTFGTPEERTLASKAIDDATNKR